MSKNIFFFVFTIFFLSCKNENKYNTFSNKFYLDGLHEIEIMEYPSRFLWDTISFNGKSSNHKDIVYSGKLTFDSTFVKEKVILNNEQRNQLIHIFSKDSCGLDFESACYEPRNLILFRDKKNKIIAYKEFCFECSNSRGSKNLEKFNGYCMEDIYKFIRALNLNSKKVNEEENKIVKEKFGQN